MSPELMEIRDKNLVKKYKGEPVDIFSSGVILFTLVRGIMPFEKATETDTAGNWPKIKKGVEMGTWEPFWERHAKQSTDLAGLTDNFKEIIQGMLHPDPDARWTMEQIKNSAWFKEDNEPLPENEVVEQMKNRRRVTKAARKAQRAAKGEKKVYRGNDGNEEFEDEESLAKIAKIKKFNPKTTDVLKTVLLTHKHPLVIFEEFERVMDEAGGIEIEKVNEDDETSHTYKFKVEIENKMIPLEDEEGEFKKEQIEMVMEMINTKDQEKTLGHNWACEFRAANGDARREFYVAFKTVTTLMDDFAVSYEEFIEDKEDLEEEE